MGLIGLFFFKKLEKERINAGIVRLEKQFKENMLSVSTLLKAGYSAENAFRQSKRDMIRIFGKNSEIVEELEILNRKLEMNIPIEDVLKSLADRSGSKHIEQFSQVFEIAKKNGGNMTEVMKSAAEIIGKDIDIKAETDTILSGKKMEFGIMKIVPFALILYISISNKGYLDSLYGNIKGVFIMTGCLAIYVAAYILGEKILRKLKGES
ncbi:MAG: type II secretion system F family protein [Lachnospiraceae bacterium]|nr:type II secretion system F family protein [Lachnospiraceae bacterium]